MTKEGLRSLEAIKLAQELVPNFSAFKKAEEKIHALRLAHVELASRDKAKQQSWEVEKMAFEQAELIDPDHRARQILYSSALHAADIVVGGIEVKTRQKVKSPWGSIN